MDKSNTIFNVQIQSYYQLSVINYQLITVQTQSHNAPYQTYPNSFQPQ
jgi:hypothetical protein